LLDELYRNIPIPTLFRFGYSNVGLMNGFIFYLFLSALLDGFGKDSAMILDSAHTISKNARVVDTLGIVISKLFPNLVILVSLH